jgi:hypothetical protein
MLPKDGDADKAVLTFFSVSGRPAKDRLVMVGDCERAVCLAGRMTLLQAMDYNIRKAIREFNREVAMGYWP